MADKAVVIGDGGWGTALAVVLERNGYDVTVWGAFPEYLAETAAKKENVKFLPGVTLPEAIRWEGNPDRAVDGASLVVLAAPSKYFARVADTFKGKIPAQTNVVSVAKGFDEESLKRMTEVAEEHLGHTAVAALSGPSHAEEVARGIPSAVVVACHDPARCPAIQEAFNNQTFRVYTSDDVIGVEVGGAMKNVIAIAAGISDGIGYGDNTKAALITRGLAEIARMGNVMGAHASTFSGLSGMGDLIVTCSSRHSRNRKVGERLGQGETKESILGSMEMVAEGVWTCANAHALSAQLDVELPLTHEVYHVLYEGKDPRRAVQDLLTRDPRPERDH